MEPSSRGRVNCVQLLQRLYKPPPPTLRQLLMSMIGIGIIPAVPGSIKDLVVGMRSPQRDIHHTTT